MVISDSPFHFGTTDMMELTYPALLGWMTFLPFGGAATFHLEDSFLDYTNYPMKHETKKPTAQS